MRTALERSLTGLTPQHAGSRLALVSTQLFTSREEASTAAGQPGVAPISLVGLTEEQMLLRDTVRSLMTRISAEPDVRRRMASLEGRDHHSWSQLRALDLVSLTIPAHLAGAGGSLVDQGVVLEEMGRALFDGPYFSTAVLATQVLSRLAGADADALLSSVARDGETLALAFTEASGRWDQDGIQLSATRRANLWQLDGIKTFVSDGADVDRLLVVARTDRGVGVFTVSGDADGLVRTALPTVDQTRRQARLDFSAVPARMLSEHGDAWPRVESALAVAAAALAMEQVGGAQRVLDMVVEHVSNRRQFDRPVGSFQAVQHKCATMLTEIEAAKSAAYSAIQAAAADAEDLPLLASLAKSYCSEVYRHATDEAIQLFGGIGLTWQHPIHLYFKRARSSEVFLGTPSYHRQLLALRLRLS